MQKRHTPNRRFVLLIIVGFVMPSSSLNISANEGDITLTREDRAEIIRDVLNREITRRREGEAKHGAEKKGVPSVTTALPLAISVSLLCDHQKIPPAITPPTSNTTSTATIIDFRPTRHSSPHVPQESLKFRVQALACLRREAAA
ncbi:MAG: hypothetical protein M3Y84_07950 [Acidobacteriota bacterium]|nr:hypothetical protein [Acidobacteriota bacterium]